MLLRIDLIIFSAILSQLAVGKYASECQLPNQKTGRCMPVKSCKTTLDLFQKIQESGGQISEAEMQSLRELQCGMFQNGVHVCCSESEVQLNPDGLDILKNQDCGSFSTDKVSFGHAAALSSFPWMALLLYNDTHDPYRCGGALISERKCWIVSEYVLTAAHCIQDELFQVRLGEHRISTDPDCTPNRSKCAPPAENVDIEESIKHPDYRRSFHDIALIRLKRRIVIPQSHIKPICLPIYDNLRGKEHKDYVISGWGRTDKVNISDVLMIALVPRVERLQCQTIMQRYRLRLPLTYGHICAGNRNLIDTCDGDSGGPLGYKDMYDGQPRFIQFGVVSFGVNYCGEGDAPNVYANVSHYLQWVTDNMRI